MIEEARGEEVGGVEDVHQDRCVHAGEDPNPSRAEVDEPASWIMSEPIAVWTATGLMTRVASALTRTSPVARAEAFLTMILSGSTIVPPECVLALPRTAPPCPGERGHRIA